MVRNTLIRRAIQHTVAVVALCCGTSIADTLKLNSGSTNISVTLDGRLDEPAWQTAPRLHLTQQSPMPGQPTPYETEVRVLFAGDRLYVGFIC